MPSNVEDVLERVLRVRRWMGVHPLNKDTSVSCLNMLFTVLVVFLPCILRFFLIFSRKDYHRQGVGIDSHLYSALSTLQSFIMLCCSLVSIFGFIKTPQKFRTLKLRLVACDLFLSRFHHPVDYDRSNIKQYIWAFSIFLVSVALFDTLMSYHFLWAVYGLVYYYHKAIVWMGELLFVAILKIIAIQMFELQRTIRIKNLIVTEKSVVEFNR